MLAMTPEEMAVEVERSGWVTLVQDYIKPSVPAQCYSTEFEACGVVGADLANLILNRFVPCQIDSGIIHVIAFDASDHAGQFALVSHLLSLSGQPPARPGTLRLKFEAEYLGLCAVMAWGIACRWEFDFLAKGARFAASFDHHEQWTVCWDEGQVLQSVVPELLQNLEFKRRT